LNREYLNKMNNSHHSVDNRIEKLVGYIDRNAMIYLIILFGINIFIKLFYADGMYYWLDETSSVFRASHPVTWMIRQSFTDPNPPLYFIILKGWMSVFGISEFSTRALSVIFSALTIFILYYLARRFFNRETAFYVSLIFTVSQIHLYFSHETRGYTLLALMGALSFYFYLQTITIPSILNLIKYTVTITLLLYIHPVPVILIIIQFICLLFYFRDNLKGTLYIIAGQFIAAILFGIWVLKNQWISKMKSWIPPPDPGKLKELLVTYLNTDFIFYLSVAILFTFIVLIIIRLLQKKTIYDDFRSFILLLSWGLLPILVIYFISQYSSRWDPRYMLFATPGLYLVIAYSVSKLPVNGLIRISFIVLILISSIIKFNLNPVKGENWPGAIAFMKEYRDDSTLTLICADYQFMSFSYYYDKDIFRQLEEAPNILKKENIFFTKGAGIFNYVDTSKYNKILLILSHEIAADPEGTLLRYLSKKYKISYTAPYMMNIKAFLYEIMNLHPADSLMFNFEKDDRFNILGEHSGQAYSGTHVSRVNKDTIYSKGLNVTLSQMNDIYSNYFTVSIKSYSKSSSASANLVCSFQKPDSIYYWNAAKIKFSDPPGTWTETSWTLNIPHIPSQDDIFKIYAYNLGDDEILFDDLQIVFYK
jgi:mannosyltransferase